MKDLIERINELANKSKVEELNDEEKKEQKQLREEYIKRFRGRMEQTLMGVKVVDEEGQDITPQKLKDAQKRKKMN